MRFYKKVLFILPSLLFPVVSYAQWLGQTRNILGSVEEVVRTILIPLVFILSLLFFFWGVAKYIWGEGQGKDEGRKIMVWGVVAIFVISSVWGLVIFLRDEFGIGGETSLPIPTIKHATIP